MSENKNIQNEEELWDLLSEPVTTEPKAKAPKFAKKAEEPKSEAPKSEPVKTEEPKAEAPKSGKKIDGFFMACMAGVAAVSVAATLLISGMTGGSTPSGSMGDPVGNDPAIVETQSAHELELERENVELRAQLEQHKTQIRELQNDLITLMGSEEYLANAATTPEGENEELDAQMKALETFAAIQEAYAEFDREKLEELIPQMDEQLNYLTPEARNNYYLILEYVEQPSNG